MATQSELQELAFFRNKVIKGAASALRRGGRYTSKRRPTAITITAALLFHPVVLRNTEAVPSLCTIIRKGYAIVGKSS